MSIVTTSDTADPTFATPDSIDELLSGLPRTSAAPEEVLALLQLAHRLLAASVIHYEFAAVAAEKALQAVELAVRHRCDLSKARYEKLVDRLAATCEFDDETIDLIHTGRKLRNVFSHPRQAAAFPLIMVVNVITGSHRIVSTLYPDSTTSAPK